MNSLEERLQRELADVSQDDGGRDFAARFAARLRNQQRRRVLLLAFATIAATALAAGLMLQLATLLSI